MTIKSITAVASALFAASALAQGPPSWAPPVEMVNPGPSGQRIAQQNFLANFFPSSDSGRHPGILVLGGSEGGLGTGTTRIAKELQAQGWSVLHLAYFGAPGQSLKLESVPLESFDRALAWLKSQPDVDPKRIAVLGGSKGAEAALLVASRHPEIIAVVAGMPSSVVWPGIDWAGSSTPGSSWSIGGKPIPYLSYGPADPRKGMRGIYDTGLAMLHQHPDARIPIERSPAPVLLVCGEADRLWPSCLMARQLAQADPHVRILRYVEAGHAVFGPPLATGDPRIAGFAALGGTPDGNQKAREDGWPKVIAFLKAAFAKA
jgi:dienelactone hydrolase